MSGTSLGWSTWTITASTGSTTTTGATNILPFDVVTEAGFSCPIYLAPMAKATGGLAGKLAAPPALRGESRASSMPRRVAPPSRPAWAVSLKAWQ